VQAPQTTCDEAAASTADIPASPPRDWLPDLDMGLDKDRFVVEADKAAIKVVQAEEVQPSEEKSMYLNASQEGVGTRSTLYKRFERDASTKNEDYKKMAHGKYETHANERRKETRMMRKFKEAGSYMSLRKVIQEEGDDDDGVAAAKNYVAKCISLGEPFLLYNAWTKRVDYLYVRRGWQETSEEAWILRQASLKTKRASAKPQLEQQPQLEQRSVLQQPTVQPTEATASDRNRKRDQDATEKITKPKAKARQVDQPGPSSKQLFDPKRKQVEQKVQRCKQLSQAAAKHDQGKRGVDAIPGIG